MRSPPAGRRRPARRAREDSSCRSTPGRRPRRAARPGRRLQLCASFDRRQHVISIRVEERVLTWPDLVDVELIEGGLLVPPDRFHMPLDVVALHLRSTLRGPLLPDATWL